MKKVSNYDEIICVITYIYVIICYNVFNKKILIFSFITLKYINKKNKKISFYKRSVDFFLNKNNC